MNVKILLLAIGIISACSPHHPQVWIQTSAGNIKVELYPDKAPVTVQNFLHYVDEGKYNGASFYRVVTPENQPGRKIKIEVIQGGLEGIAPVDSFPGIPHETTLQTGIHHLDGTLSMARDKPGTASTEFFICIGNQPELDYGGKRNPDLQGFAAFGRVLEGMDVVRSIQHMPADSNQMLVQPVTILHIKRIGYATGD